MTAENHNEAEIQKDAVYALKQKLERADIDTASWGTGKTKTIAHLLSVVFPLSKIHSFDSLVIYVPILPRRRD